VPEEEELQQQVQELGTKTGPGVQIIDGTWRIRSKKSITEEVKSISFENPKWERYILRRK